jgi:Undecaprenyl-phosphate galactose phosphotransferase WbaP
MNNMQETATEPLLVTTQPMRLETSVGTSVDHSPALRQVGLRYTKQLLRVSLPLALTEALLIAMVVFVNLLCVSLFLPVAQHVISFPLLTTLALITCFSMSGLYPGIGLQPYTELKLIIQALFTFTVTSIFGLLLISNWRNPYAWSLIVSLPILCFGLPILRSMLKDLMRHFSIGIPCYFLGNRIEVFNCFREMTRFGHTLLMPSGRFCEAEDESNYHDMLDVSPDFETKFERLVAYRGTPDEIVKSACANDVFWLFNVGQNSIAPSLSHSIVENFTEIIRVESGSNRNTASAIFGAGLVTGVRYEEVLLHPWSRLVKRTMDIVVAGGLMLLLSPIFAILMTLVKLTSSGPIFFSHNRIGRGGQDFKAWKFRSMIPNAQAVLKTHLEASPEARAEWQRDQKLKDDPRITWIGKILRKTSLDELPQLWNVLVGDMSLVGPRPIVEAEIAKYGDTFRHYLRVTPGITGLWQISGRNNTTYSERLAYDEFYARNWSTWLDFYILLRTIRTVALCEGAY